jgi:hypothetical protein
MQSETPVREVSSATQLQQELTSSAMACIADLESGESWKVVLHKEDETDL